MKNIMPVLLGLIVAANAMANSNKIINPDNDHSYQRIDTEMTWHNAKTHCEDLGGHLATVTSQEESQYVIDL